MMCFRVFVITQMGGFVMCELMKDATGEMILAGAKEVITSVKEKREWKALFVDTGEFFIKDVGCAEKLIDDIVVLMSKSNMEELAKSVNKNNGFELRSSLERELTGLMKMYEIPHDQAEYYTCLLYTSDAADE